MVGTDDSRTSTYNVGFTDGLTRTRGIAPPARQHRFEPESSLRSTRILYGQSDKVARGTLDCGSDRRLPHLDLHGNVGVDDGLTRTRGLLPRSGAHRS